MKYENVIKDYQSNRSNSALLEERVLAMCELFKALKEEGLTKLEVTRELLDSIGETSTEEKWSDSDKIKLKSSMMKLFFMIFHSLDQGQPVAQEAKAESETDVEDSKMPRDEISKMKPEDFKDKELDWEFMKTVGAVDHPDKGGPDE